MNLVDIFTSAVVVETLYISIIASLSNLRRNCTFAYDCYSPNSSRIIDGDASKDKLGWIQGIIFNRFAELKKRY